MKAKPGSNPLATSSLKAAPLSPQFTRSEQPAAAECPDRPEEEAGSAEMSPDSTDPFPPGLFRVPVPNAVFARMPDMSASALQCLLGLIHLSFRFDPVEDEWTCLGEWFSRRDIESATGLSSQGTRNGLSELASVGWAKADRSARSHQHKLSMGVPTRRFTYVPTALLESLSGEADGTPSGTDLQVLLAVLRATWGWTHREMRPESGSPVVTHDRWAQLSNQALAKMTGRSETAVTRAARSLQGTWIGRARPGSGPYQYRFLPGAVGDAPGDEPDEGKLGEDRSERKGELEKTGRPKEKSGPEETGRSKKRGAAANSGRDQGRGANDLTPDRQKSDPPSSNKKSFFKDKHSQLSERSSPGQRTKLEGAVPTEKPNENRPGPGRRDHSGEKGPEEKSPPPTFEGLSPKKRDLAEKLANVGVWAGRITEVLSRFSCSRVRANFELYRRRAREQRIQKPGAWLYKAITDGYATPVKDASNEGVSAEALSTEARPKEGASALAGSSSSPPQHKETVPQGEKETYVTRGVPEERFHRCLSGNKARGEPQFMYFDPEIGSPTSRI